MESLKAQEWDTYLLEWNKTWKEKQKLNNGSLGATVFVVPVSFVFLKMRGKVFGWRKLPPPFLTIFVQGVLAQVS